MYQDAKIQYIKYNIFFNKNNINSLNRLSYIAGSDINFLVIFPSMGVRSNVVGL
jgi:hypothetical protein